MAIPTVFASGAAVNSTGAALTPAIPTGTVAGDVLLLVHEMDPALNAAALGAVTGYADVLGSPQSQTAASLPTRLTVRWHRATGAESGTITVPAVTDHHVAQLIGVRGCITSGNPWDVTAGNLDNGTTATATLPTLTTAASDCLIVNLLSTGTDVNSTAQVSGWTNAGLASPSITELSDNWTLSGGGGGFGGAYGGKAIPAAVTATTATMVTGTVKALLTIALRPELTARFTRRSPNRRR